MILIRSRDSEKSCFKGETQKKKTKGGRERREASNATEVKEGKRSYRRNLAICPNKRGILKEK